MTLFHSLPLPVLQLSLPAVLKSGQSFRWSVHNIQDAVEYRLCLRDRLVCLRQSPTTLFYRAVYPDSLPNEAKDAETLAWLNDYFQLHVDLDGLYEQWSTRDHVFANIQSRFQGIRVLRQDPWENLISFICSSNNNISRITNMVNALCEHYSPPLLSLPDESRTYHPFPPPSALAAPGVTGALRSLGFGYRADFIHRTAKMLVDTHGTSPLSSPIDPSEQWLMNLRTRTTEEAREELLKFVGVGRKVADCILLMSLDKRDVIPVDTHVIQIATKYYGLKSAPNGKKVTMTPKLYNDVTTRLGAVWGDYAGWAHSVLFTADLKSFSSYGLESSPPSPVKISKKRKQEIPPVVSKQEQEEILRVTELVLDASVDTLAERVKKRRRL